MTATTRESLPTPEVRPPRECRWPLQNGDHLTRPEFERRWDATPWVKKAELLEGVVYVPPPLSDEHHGWPHLKLGACLGVYIAATPGLTGGDNSSVRLDLESEPQPDLYIRVLESHGGQATRSKDGYLERAPDLCAEIAASSASYDLHTKLRVYRRHGVREYVVWRTLDETFDWLILRDGRYEALQPDAGAVYRSEIFPGLWIDAGALVRDDLAAALRTLQAGIATAEHTAFVASLQVAAGRPDVGRE